LWYGKRPPPLHSKFLSEIEWKSDDFLTKFLDLKHFSTVFDYFHQNLHQLLQQFPHSLFKLFPHRA
jgi:hypothetical protein